VVKFALIQLVVFDVPVEMVLNYIMMKYLVMVSIWLKLLFFQGQNNIKENFTI